MDKQYNIDKETIALCKIDEINYLVIRTQKMLGEKPTFKVQSWNSDTNGFAHTDYDKTLNNALTIFYTRINNLIKERMITKHHYGRNEPINEDQGLDEHFENRTDLSSYNNDPTHY